MPTRPRLDAATLSECAERVLEDYKRVSLFIRTHAPADEQVQMEAQTALHYLRLVAGKLTWLAITLESEDDAP